MNRRCALVTGASRGIGAAIAVRLAEDGLDVAVNYVKSREAAERVVEGCATAGVKAMAIQADLSEDRSRIALLEMVRETFGRLDVLVNNAGVAPSHRADILEAEPAEFDRLVAVNLRAPFFLTRDAARWMLEQQTAHPERRFHIVNVTSISAYTSSPERAGYCVSKAGLSMATRLYADRLAARNVSVYEVRPGIIFTDMTRGVADKYDGLIREGLLPIPRWGQPEDVAAAVGALASDALPYSTGDVVNVDGGFHLRRL